MVHSPTAARAPWRDVGTGLSAARWSVNPDSARPVLGGGQQVASVAQLPSCVCESEIWEA